MNTENLQEAIDRVEAQRRWGYGALSVALNAARAVLAAEEWVVCKTHGHRSVDTDKCAGAMLMLLPQGDCEMVPARLLIGDTDD